MTNSIFKIAKVTKAMKNQCLIANYTVEVKFVNFRNFKSMKIVFASNNHNKVVEVRQVLPSDFEILTLADIDCTEEIPETASTIEGNAILKANYITEKYGLNCFADDTGLEVDALDGAPGVYSARYAGDQRNSEDNIDKLLIELKGNSNRRANFKTVVALNINGEQHLFTGNVNGEITEKPRGTMGFGYDSVFKPDGHSLTFAEIPLSEKAEMSHRGKAIAKLVEFLNQR